MHRWVIALSLVVGLASVGCNDAPCCAVDSDCADGICAFGRCTEVCSSDEDCAVNEGLVQCVRVDGIASSLGVCRAVGAPDDQCLALRSLAPDPRDDAGPPPVVDAGPPRECEPDPFEPNNGISEATVQAPFGTLSICDLDRDVFRIEASADTEIEVIIRFTHADGDLDVLLENSFGTILAEARSGSDDETLRFVTRDGGQFFARVFADPQVTNTYTFTSTVRNAPPPGDGGPLPCLNDINEPNNVQANAANVVFPTAARLCAGDIDWFNIPAPATTNEIELAADVDNLRLRLVREDGATVDEVVSPQRLLTQVPLGTYAVEVLDLEDRDIAYNLAVDVRPIDQCTDIFEPNDVIDEAVELSQLPAFAQICDDDRDFYVVNATQGTRVGARIEFSDDIGDLDLKLYNPDGFELDSSFSTGDVEEVSATAEVSGDHFIEVFGFGGDLGPYRVVEFGAQCEDDGFEPNDLRNQPTLNPPDIINAFACDNDHYLFNGAAGTQVSFTLTHQAVAGSFELVVEGPSGGAPTVVNTVNGRADVTVDVNNDSAFIVRVRALESTGESYRLAVTRSGFCEDDFLEENDTADDAPFLLSIDSTDATFCEGDLDFYRVLTLGDAFDFDLVSPDPGLLATFSNIDTGEIVLVVDAASGFTSVNVGDGNVIQLLIQGDASAPYTMVFLQQ